MSETCEVEIAFQMIPTIKQAIDEKMFADVDPLSLLIWFPALWTAGRYGHVYFAHAGVPYHVSNLQTSELRHKFNTEERLSYTFTLKVLRRNLAKATLLCEDANGNHWRHPICNCTHTISMLLYGEPNHYAWIGRFGWATRRVLKDVQTLQAAQLT